MAIVFTGRMNVPNYTALTTDLAGGILPGAQPGMVIFLSDNATWKIVQHDLSLATYALPVTLSPSASIDIGDVTLLAGEAYIGKTGGSTTVVTVAPVLTVAATYATGDYVGTSAAPMTFSSCARVAGGTGLITGCMLIDYNLQSVSGELWLFDASVSAPADSAAWSLSDADMLKCIGVIPFSTYYASALNSVSFGVPTSAPIVFKCGSALRELYGCFVTRGAPAYASGDLTFRLSVLQD
ncbi:MAG: hypothetical protein WA061_02250 [Microgenomates group bacterium]